MKWFCSSVVALALTASAGLAEMLDLEGSVVYREKIAMPSGAMVEVTLQDISLADAPSVELATVVIRPEGQVPVDYRLVYDSGMVKAGHRYAVQAKITVADDVIWRTTQVFPALGENDPERVDVMVEKTQRFEFSGTKVPEQLTQSSYIVVAMNGEAVQTERVPELVFAEDGKISGTSGCNRFNGTVEVDGEAMTFGPLASTRMACPGPLDAQEAAFFAALSQVTGFAFENGVALTDQGGNILLQLMAQ
ncbi:putative lipoprotein [Shimia isoporae]|uniref:Putative lipoprotein n=1 Tax=Shimia isoporae TaxID=647720 RepID=A0A4R1NP69_9RHOB|nr:META domain-containing protein [Shimia isoporae]TCL10257.1 putative lipoprotein [Shimia isoporae]